MTSDKDFRSLSPGAAAQLAQFQRAGTSILTGGLVSKAGAKELIDKDIVDHFHGTFWLTTKGRSLAERMSRNVG